MITPSHPPLTIIDHGAVRTITLSRPDVRNAFNDEVIAELKNAFTEAGQAADVRCVVLAAKGCLLYTSDAADE